MSVSLALLCTVSPLAAQQAPAVCEPTCASGYACDAGFCVPEGATDSTSGAGAELTAPDLALGKPVAPAPQGRNARRHKPSPDDDFDPETGNPRDLSDYRHQGFYLRISAGPSLVWLERTFDSTGIVDTAATNGALNGTFELSMGGTLGGVVVLGGRVMTPANIAFSGGFIDVYPEPTDGVHFDAAIGAVGGNSLPGGSLGVGYDLFFAPEWSAGVLFRAMSSIPGDTRALLLSATILLH